MRGLYFAIVLAVIGAFGMSTLPASAATPSHSVQLVKGKGEKGKKKHHKHKHHRHHKKTAA